MEYWKDIEGYEGLYQVSTHGRVKNSRTGKFLNGYITSKGYIRVQLCNNGIKLKYFIHRLVAQSFIPNPHNKPEVNHIDENKQNNYVNNLEWVTSKENITYGTRTLNSAMTQAKPIICIETGIEFYGINECARQMGLHPSKICMVLNGKLNKTGGYTFKYIEKD